MDVDELDAAISLHAREDRPQTAAIALPAPRPDARR